MNEKLAKARAEMERYRAVYGKHEKKIAIQVMAMTDQEVRNLFESDVRPNSTSYCCQGQEVCMHDMRILTTAWMTMNAVRQESEK